VIDYFKTNSLASDTPYHLEALLSGVPEPARCGLDIALYDLIGKDLDIPLWQLLGFDQTSTVTSSRTIGIEDSIDIVLERVRELGDVPILKVKLGAGRDVDIIENIRSIYGGTLRIDVNEGWSPDQAVTLLREMQHHDIELCEQPIPAGHPEQLRYVREHVTIPIVADEDSVTPHDLPALRGCVDGVNLKLAKVGGIRAALAFVSTARALDMKIMLGCMLETSILATAAAHVSPLVDWIDLDGPLFLADDPFVGITLDNGRIVLPTGPGVGVRRAEQDGSSST
jgi:L-Ala-D/L-Glu epimerase